MPVGVAAGDAVTLIRPQIRMRLEPGSLDDPMVAPNKREIVFRAVQDHLA